MQHSSKIQAFSLESPSPTKGFKNQSTSCQTFKPWEWNNKISWRSLGNLYFK
ncbi:UNVERIFIED_CONTAM: hypothetical protein FKN15_050607 [Acipenser sinensis]